MDYFKNVTAFIYRYAIVILLVLIGIAASTLMWLGGSDTKPVSSKPLYHFFFIAQNSVDPFWHEVVEGVKDSAKEHNVVIEFCMPRFNNPSEQLQYLDIGTLSRVDGIITHVPGIPGYTEAIDKAYGKGIPVITFENDDSKSKRYAFVGTNNFVIGREAAKLLVKATGGRANIAVISNNDFDQGSVEHNLKMNGFISTLKDYPNMNVIRSYTSKMGILSAEEITQTIIDGEDDINAIFTVSSADTLGSAQLIVDSNKVGDVTLVGYGSSEEILRYIDKEIIFGTVASDPYKMGYDSLKALIDIKEGQSVSTFIDTEVKVITKKNLNSLNR